MSDDVRQGDVWQWDSPAGRLRVVVMSNDEYNVETGLPVVVPLQRGSGPGSTYLVPTNTPDPVGGVVVIGQITPVPAAELVERVGTITGQTLERIRLGFAKLIG